MVHDTVGTTRKLEIHELIRLVSRNPSNTSFLFLTVTCSKPGWGSLLKRHTTAALQQPNQPPPTWPGSKSPWCTLFLKERQFVHILYTTSGTGLHWHCTIHIYTLFKQKKSLEFISVHSVKSRVRSFSLYSVQNTLSRVRRFFLYTSSIDKSQEFLSLHSV